MTVEVSKFNGLVKVSHFEELDTVETLRTLCENIFITNPDVAQLEETEQANGDFVFTLRNAKGRVINRYQTLTVLDKMSIDIADDHKPIS